jgi:hypothetical protein
MMRHGAANATACRILTAVTEGNGGQCGNKRECYDHTSGCKTGAVALLAAKASTRLASVGRHLLRFRWRGRKKCWRLKFLGNGVEPPSHNERQYNEAGPNDELNKIGRVIRVKHGWHYERQSWEKYYPGSFWRVEQR